MNCPSCEHILWTEDSFEGHWEAYHQPTEGPLVAEMLGCPQCGERRMNQLEWVGPDMEEIECQTCSRVSTP